MKIRRSALATALRAQHLSGRGLFAQTLAGACTEGTGLFVTLQWVRLRERWTVSMRGIARELVLGCAITIVGGAILTPLVYGANVVVDHDTTIDAGSPISGAHIDVVDGISGATHVNVISGGSVAGFNGHDNSETVLNGGSVTYLSSLDGNATFIMNSGQVGCTEALCQVIDYDSLIQVNDFSTLRLFGGTLAGIVRLNDSSVAHFYGQKLSLNVFDQSFASVEGTYLNGDLVQATFQFRPDIASHIVLHNVPEPSTASGVLALFYFLLDGARIRRNRGVVRRDHPLIV